jgi:hypothetical protein
VVIEITPAGDRSGCQPKAARSIVDAKPHRTRGVGVGMAILWIRKNCVCCVRMAGEFRARLISSPYAVPLKGGGGGNIMLHAASTC